MGCASSKTTDDKDDLKLQQQNMTIGQHMNGSNKLLNAKNGNGTTGVGGGQSPQQSSSSTTQINNLNLLTDLLNDFFDSVGNGDLQRLQMILNNLDDKKKKKIKIELLNAGMSKADGLTSLSIAAGRKHKNVTEYLAALEEVDVNKSSESGITPLLMVAEVGWTDIMEKLLQRGANVDSAPKGLKAEEAKIAGSTPLIGATKYNNPDAVRLLLKHKANPNHQNQSGISALMLAAEQGFYECVRYLVEGGANVELAPTGKTALNMNLSGQTPLFCAAKEGHIEIVKYLLEKSANPNACNHYGVSVLWIPCQRGLYKIVELLLEYGADTEISPSGPEAEERSISGWTPLYAAIKSRQFSVVKLLLNYNANPNAITSLGSTPFLLGKPPFFFDPHPLFKCLIDHSLTPVLVSKASEIGDLDVIKCFVEHGADLDYAPSGKEADELNITGQTALFMATLKEQNDVVRYLIEKGSKVNVKNRYGVSPLLLCAEGGNEHLVELLCNAGADINMSPSGQLAMEHILAGQTPLYGAAKKGHYNICKYLIEHGAVIDAETMTGATPLYTAVEEGHFDIVKLLCDHGASVNKCPNGEWARELNINLQSPLLLACLKNNTQIAEFLIHHGADVNLVNERGSSPLLAVCQYDNLILLQLLIAKGAKIDQEALNLYDAKINALIIATESGSHACVKCLVENGLDVNYKIKGKGETSGRTPLFCASVKNHPNIVEYLVKGGADVNATEDSGLSCLHIAATLGHDLVVEILCANYANINQSITIDDHQVTAYDLAVTQEKTDVCQILIKYGYQLN